MAIASAVGDVAISRWPKIPNFVFADADMLPAPAVSDFDLSEASVAVALDPKNRARSQTAWPQLAALQVASIDAALPVPAANVFDIPEKARAEIEPFPLTMHHYAEGELPAYMTAAAVPHSRRGRGRVALHQRATRVAHAAAGRSRKAPGSASGGWQARRPCREPEEAQDLTPDPSGPSP